MKPPLIDRSQLETLYALPSPAPIRDWRIWMTRFKVWLNERVTVLELSMNPPENAITRRLRIHQYALNGAKRLHRLDRNEAKEILRVTGMLLGFDRKSNE